MMGGGQPSKIRSAISTREMITLALLPGDSPLSDLSCLKEGELILLMHIPDHALASFLNSLTLFTSTAYHTGVRRV